MASPAQVLHHTRSAMSVWDDLVGQDQVVRQLATAARAAAVLVTRAAGGPMLDLDGPGLDSSQAGPFTDRDPSPKNGRAEFSSMTHAWLFTGPPGAGRATAARAFAAALQCVSSGPANHPEPGCGFCEGCHTTLIGTHADVDIIRAELLTIGVKETRDLVRRSSLAPSNGRWQVIVVEDADRLTEGAGNVLLKAIEEPAPRTVWLLCAPSLEDALPTIRSRCRHLVLRTPPIAAVADVLVRRDGIDPATAEFAARAAQGHIDRARRLATDESARTRRNAVLRIPSQVNDIGGCLKAAQMLVDSATEDARQVAEEMDAKETEELRAALGAAAGVGGRLPRGTAGAVKELQDRQKRRATRTQRDTLDLALVDLAGYYRDVLAVQIGAGGELASMEQRASIDDLATTSSPENTLRRIEAVLRCRTALEENVAPLLAVEAMTLALRAG